MSFDHVGRFAVDGETFAFAHDVHVRWADVDRMGHVNNVMYARYVESARVGYFANTGLFGAHAPAVRRVGPIVARLTVDFRAPVVDPDRVRVHVATTKVGTSSAVHRYVLTSEAGGERVVAEATCTWVLYDYAAAAKVAIPAELRAAIAAFEAGVGRTVEGAP